jgi:PAS domain S-box-containing protein
MQLSILGSSRYLLQLTITCILVVIVEVSNHFAIPTWKPALLFLFFFPVVFLSFSLYQRLLRRTSRAYQEHIHLLQTFINEAPAAIAMLDQDLRYIAVSKRWIQDFKLTNCAIIGQRHYDVFPEIPEHWKEVHRRCLAGAVESAQEDLFIRLDGSKQWISWEVRPWMLADKPNEIGGLIMFTEDVTTRKETLERELTERAKLETEHALRAQAELALQRKRNFIATLSHELRSPLNAMLGWTQLLKRVGNDPARVSQAVQAIESSGQILSQLISDILDINRISSGKLLLNIEKTAIRSIIDRAIEIVYPEAQKKQLHVEADLTDSAGLIMGDPVRLQQCLWNLLSNAIKFTPKDGRITVSTKTNQQNLEISITDTGCGIQSDIIPQIFERFVQADSSSTRVHGGLGLGLAITKHLVELHGGSVSAESAGRGQGSRFTISLPLETQQSSSLPNSAPLYKNDQLAIASDTLKNLSVLIVDDHIEARELLRGALEDSGAKVYSASCAKSALEIASKHPTDIIISDIAMPDRDGCALIGDLRAKGLSTPTIALSAYASGSDKERALNAGFNRYLTKPVQLERLFQTVRELSRHQSTVSDKR